MNKPIVCTIEQVAGGMHVLMVPATAAASLLKKGTKRFLCTIGTHSFHCSLQSRKEGGCYVAVGGALRKKLAVKAGDPVTARFEPDDSEHGLQMPEELAEVLRTDPAADKAFGALTPGARRTVMHYVLAVKAVDKRIDRALRIAEGLNRGVRSARDLIK